MALVPISGASPLFRDTETGLVVRSEAELKKLRDKQPTLADLQTNLEYLSEQVVALQEMSKAQGDRLMILTSVLLEVTPELKKLVPEEMQARLKKFMDEDQDQDRQTGDKDQKK